MNWLDIILAIILAVAIFWGLRKGLIKSILSLLGLILGVFLAGRLYTPFAGILKFLPEQAAKVLAYIIILLVVIIVMYVIATILDKILHAIMLGWLNHIGGAVIGFLFASIFLGAILAIWAKYAGGSNLISHSFLGTFLLDKFPLALSLLPSEFNSIRQFFQ